MILRIMQFQQPDTIIPNLYNPQSLNHFSYGFNNPSRFTDPSGHIPWAHTIILDDQIVSMGGLGGGRGSSASILQALPVNDKNGSDNNIFEPRDDERPEIPVDPTQRQVVDDPPPPPQQSGLQRAAEIYFGLYLIGEGFGIMGLGGIVVVTALSEMVGGTVTGPFAPLVEVHAGIALAIGAVTVVIGGGIVGVGALILFMGITGTNPLYKNE